MADAHHITDEEYQHLIIQDQAEDSADPWHRSGPYGTDPEPVHEKPTGQRAQWQPRRYKPEPPVVCAVCHQLRVACICDPGNRG